MILAVDPGVTYCGLALFSHGRLIDQHTPKIPVHTRTVDRASAIVDTVNHWCYTSRVPAKTTGVPMLECLVVEGMFIYPPKFQNKPPNDVMAVQTIVGALLAGVPAARRESPLAREWKGQLAKMVHHAQVTRKLFPEEKPMFENASEHARDAIALGLWALRRQKEDIK